MRFPSAKYFLQFACVSAILPYCGCATGPQEPQSRAGDISRSVPSAYSDSRKGVSVGAISESSNVLGGSANAASRAVLESSIQSHQAFLVNVSTLNVRSLPVESSPKVSTLSQGTLVQVWQIKEDWAQVGDSQWVYLPYLRLCDP